MENNTVTPTTPITAPITTPITAPITSHVPESNKAFRRENRLLAALPPAPLPDWLSAHPDPAAQQVRFKRTPVHRELELITFEAILDKVLEELTMGVPVSTTLAEDVRQPHYGRFQLWLHDDPARLIRYRKAQMVSTEASIEKMDRIAEGTDTLEDIERSKLRLAQEKFKVQTWNRQRYGDSKQVEITNNTTIDIRALIEKRDQQLLNLSSTYENDTTPIPSIMGALPALNDIVDTNGDDS